MVKGSGHVYVCLVEGCEATGQGKRGLCNTHYTRWYKEKDACCYQPVAVKLNRQGISLEERLSLLVVEVCSEKGCWKTKLSKQARYKQISVNGVSKMAHRVAYELKYGPIEEGLEADHLCGVTCCINPDHIEPVPHQINMHRALKSATGANAAKEKCIHGHLFDAENTYYTPNGNRQCRACHYNRNKAWKERKAKTLSLLGDLGA